MDVSTKESLRVPPEVPTIGAPGQGGVFFVENIIKQW